MYKIVYTIIDDARFKYFDEMMISIASVRKYMPDIEIEIILDDVTYNYIKTDKSRYDNCVVWAHFNVISIEGDYTNKEKSRFLKTSLRNTTQGDYLFIDTDTIICDKFPEQISSKEIGAVLDGNTFISEHMYRNGTKSIIRKSGLDYKISELYFNSGVIWVRDTPFTHLFYKEWNDLWKEGLKKDSIVDQPSFNKLAVKYASNFDQLDGVWNCQVSSNPFPIQFLPEAKIIHYYNTVGSPYILCNPTIKEKGYMNTQIQCIMEKPKEAFSKSVLFQLSGYEDFYDSNLFKFIKALFLKNRKVFIAIDNIIKHFMRGD